MKGAGQLLYGVCGSISFVTLSCIAPKDICHYFPLIKNGYHNLAILIPPGHSGTLVTHHLHY